MQHEKYERIPGGPVSHSENMENAVLNWHASHTTDADCRDRGRERERGVSACWQLGIASRADEHSLNQYQSSSRSVSAQHRCMLSLNNYTREPRDLPIASIVFAWARLCSDSGMERLLKSRLSYSLQAHVIYQIRDLAPRRSLSIPIGNLSSINRKIFWWTGGQAVQESSQLISNLLQDTVLYY